MPIVTIRGQMGSGAQEIGKQVAERLHVDYIDRQIIAQVAELLDERRQDVSAKEMPPDSLWGRIAQALTREAAAAGACAMEPSVMMPYSGAYLPAWQIPLNDRRYLSGLESVINQLARSQAAVICGRGSQFILKDYPGVLHVLVVAPIETRVNRVMQSMQTDRGTAEKEIAHSDGSRREFIKRYFHAEIEDPLYYGIVVNTGYLSFDNAASIIVNTLRLRDMQ